MYTYDLMNKMDEVGTTTDVTTLTNATEINANIYNENGQRISKTEEDSTTKYFYTGTATLYTTDEHNNILQPNTYMNRASIKAQST